LGYEEKNMEWKHTLVRTINAAPQPVQEPVYLIHNGREWVEGTKSFYDCCHEEDRRILYTHPAPDHGAEIERLEALHHSTNRELWSALDRLEASVEECDTVRRELAEAKGVANSAWKQSRLKEEAAQALREQVRVLSEALYSCSEILPHAKAALNRLHSIQPDNPEGDHYARHYSHLEQSCQRVIDESSAALAAVKGGLPKQTAAARDVLAERSRQINAEGWTPEHDDAHEDGDLEMAASCYAYNVADPDPEGEGRAPFGWPWDISWWKPSTPRRDLVKACALILAAIERRDRAAVKGEQA
jgi:hypothetical protein